MPTNWDKFKGWFNTGYTGEDLKLYLQQDGGLSPLAARWNNDPAMMALLGVRQIKGLHDLPLTSGAARFIQSKITALPRKLVRKSTNEDRSTQPDWLHQANPVNSFTSELNAMLAELMWNGEVFVLPLTRRGEVSGFRTFRGRDVELESIESDGYTMGKPVWSINGEVVPRLTQIKVGSSVGDIRGKGIMDSAQDLLQAYDLSVRWTSALYEGKLTQLLYGDFQHMDDEELDEFKKSFNIRSSGIENIGEVIFVPSNDVHIKTLSLDPQQMTHTDIMKELARTILTQCFLIQAQFFNLNQSGTQVTYANLDALGERLVQDTLWYWIVPIEDGFSRMLRDYYLKLDLRNLLGGTVSEKTNRAKVMTDINNAGEVVFTPQEIREAAGLYGWPEELTQMREQEEQEQEQAPPAEFGEADLTDEESEV